MEDRFSTLSFGFVSGDVNKNQDLDLDDLQMLSLHCMLLQCLKRYLISYYWSVYRQQQVSTVIFSSKFPLGLIPYEYLRCQSAGCGEPSDRRVNTQSLNKNVRGHQFLDF